MKSLCQRCSYDESDPEVTLPDFFWYDALCAHCAAELHKKQAKMEG